MKKSIICKQCDDIVDEYDYMTHICMNCKIKEKTEMPKTNTRFVLKHYSDHTPGDIRTCQCGERYLQIYVDQDICTFCYRKKYARK